MEPYIEFIGTPQNSGFWLVKVGSMSFGFTGHIDRSSCLAYTGRETAEMPLIPKEGATAACITKPLGLSFGQALVPSCATPQCTMS